ncbi:ABC transporter ATP-binding protein [Labrenzia sp. PHM005]|uniref:ABC transporter ATP-binding protein n=1 Tax=Labrenzia sp. PHM005 TaxID=2590016 RepID=UPI0011407F3F|nr:ABC transporter ATP-binding protein [Labrenzia sp. PHM005]QDG77614.1 ABC transporter ATP-binding protein [Labrenzia sp. PHM005]
MISIQDLTFTYAGGGFGLRIKELSISQGEQVAVIGPSGSGKSTLLHLIAGLLFTASGSVDVFGKSLKNTPERVVRRLRAQQLGFIFQDFGLLEYLTARANILYPYAVCSVLKRTPDTDAYLNELAKTAGIADLLHRHPKALSQGEKQRVAICRALLHRPKLILADEATGNLDPDNKTIILDLIQEIAAETGATVLAVTHDHELLPRFKRVIDFRDLRAGAETQNVKVSA